jgi:hypothetical protein
MRCGTNTFVRFGLLEYGVTCCIAATRLSAFNTSHIVWLESNSIGELPKLLFQFYHIGKGLIDGLDDVNRVPANLELSSADGSPLNRANSKWKTDKI